MQETEAARTQSWQARAEGQSFRALVKLRKAALGVTAGNWLHSSLLLMAGKPLEGNHSPPQIYSQEQYQGLRLTREDVCRVYNLVRSCCHGSVVEARKEEPGADMEQDPGGRNDLQTKLRLFGTETKIAAKLEHHKTKVGKTNF